MKKFAILLTVATVLTLGLAQESHHLETRLSIAEDRIGRLEMDISRLQEVPSTLARIEERLVSLAEKQGNTGGILQTVGLGIIMSVVSGAIAYQQGRSKRPE